MNRTSSTYSRSFSIAMLVGAFLISTEAPLLASPPQSSESTTAGQKDKDKDPLPDAPLPQSAAGQQTTPAPSGAAGAKAATVKGAPVAQPAGAAVAPVRQRGHRSLLIKLGVLAGAGIAVGAVVALSEKSPSRPPGAPSIRP
jgi:hypothetical protein